MIWEEEQKEKESSFIHAVNKSDDDDDDPLARKKVAEEKRRGASKQKSNLNFLNPKPIYIPIYKYEYNSMQIEFSFDFCPFTLISPLEPKRPLTLLN